ncbi:MAG: hypothetical protein AMS17_09625 [Spirochaetes bacterium DG_61]|nr:MAG: hypothetical protein AMS17_09625 [Spirochaetes bacterium DG_61]
MRPFPYVRKILSLILIFLVICNFSWKKTEERDPFLYFLAYGVLIKVDPVGRELSTIGFFHPTAPAVARAADGLFWARIDEKHMGAMNPETGRIEARVQLSQRPYTHIIIPDGKAYITHHTLTHEGFMVSVVNTRKKRVEKEIKHINGLRTDLIYHDPYVYLAAIGVKENDYLYLYRIDTKRDRLEEMYREPLAEYVWRMAAKNDLIYLCHINRGAYESVPIVEVFATSTRKIVKTFTLSDSGIAKVIGRIELEGERLLVPCITERETLGIAFIDIQNGEVEKIFPLQGKPYRILGTRRETLVYIDNPMDKGREGVSLYFFDLEVGREVIIVNIPKFIEQQLKTQ